MTTTENTIRVPSSERAADRPLVSVVIPCLNEAENIEQCVASAREVLERHGIAGEVVVADNDSEDGSRELAEAAGARVVREPRRGYGSAYLAGFEAARGDYIVMGDADLTYDFNEIPRFLGELQDGADMVIGDRMKNIHPGAMPWLHRYVGNPVLSGFLNFLFRTGVSDAHCGMRAVRRDKLPQLALRTTGMEFASEMVIRAAKEKLDIRQFPIEYHPRGGESKLSSFRDGWRHLRFLLVHSPTHLFILPGVLMTLFGALVGALVLARIDVLGRQWDIHALIGGSLLMVVGTQVVGLGLCAHAYGTYFMHERDPWFDRMRARYKLEHGLLLGGVVALAGVASVAVIVVEWANRGFGSLGEERLAVVALTLVIVGIQIFFSSFLLSILGLRRRPLSVVRVTFVLAVIVFPLLLVGLSFGVGLLVERAAGLTLPAVLLAPLGYAGIIGLTQVTTWSGAIAPLTPAIVVVVALGGFAVGGQALLTRWRARRSGWWWGWAPALVAYLVAAAPVLLTGHVTFPGYLLDTTGAIQLIGIERLLAHGHSFTVSGSSYGLALHAFFGTGYPSGAHTALGGVGRLTGVDPIWLYAPYLATTVALSAFPLTFVARRAGLSRPAAALAGVVSSMPALVYAYLLQGSIKEIALLPTLALLGALVVLAREQLAGGPRAAIPLGVAGAAGWATVGFAFMPWLALSAVAVLALGWGALAGDRRARLRAVALRAGWALGALVLLALPSVASIGTSLNLATSVSNNNPLAVADPGNLVRPLLKVQLLGVWLGSSHRTDPEHLTQTYLLIGVVAVGALLGAIWLWRQRQWGVLAYVALSVLVWLALTPRSTTWTSAKLLVLLSPVVVLVACIGALGRLGSRRLEGLLLAAAITAGVLGSDAYLYHATTIAPTDALRRAASHRDALRRSRTDVDARLRRVRALPAA